MTDRLQTERRQLMKLLAALGLTGASGSALASSSLTEQASEAMMPGEQQTGASGQCCEGDGTPLQFIPKTPPDANPLENELDKYPRCPYCGMDRAKFHHSRHLVHYDDDLVDGVCSIHCLAISLTLNLDRGPKAIYAADFSSDAEIKPLVPVDGAVYLIDSRLKGTMSKKSKMAFATEAAAGTAQGTHGGEVANFDEALRITYLDMAGDTAAIRKRRMERHRRSMSGVEDSPR